MLRTLLITTALLAASDTEGKTAQNYRAMGVPVTYLLDREGRMLAGKTGPQAWDSAEMQRLIRTAAGVNK